MGEDRTGHQSGRRVTVDQAARHLGLSVDAVRKRVQRDQIAQERDQAGRVRIILDESETIQDEPQDTTRPDHTEELIATLREQLAAERQAHAEARRLLAAALERIPPQLEAPSEPPGAPTEAAGEPERTEPWTGGPGPQERVSRPWWRRVFGG